MTEERYLSKYSITIKSADGKKEETISTQFDGRLMTLAQIKADLIETVNDIVRDSR